jgi:hypothetical protein
LVPPVNWTGFFLSGNRPVHGIINALCLYLCLLTVCGHMKLYLTLFLAREFILVNTICVRESLCLLAQIPNNIHCRDMITDP